MKNRLREIIPILILIYCLIIIPIILYHYSTYLSKPDNYTWDQVEKYLISSGKYSQEPIVFNPGWLKNYATDIYGLPRKFNISENNNGFYIYWLISLHEDSISPNYQVIENQKIDNLFIKKLRRK